MSKGFLYKDLCLFWTTWKSYTVVMALFLALTLLDLLDVSFLFTFFPILLCMSCATSLTWDELANWDRFAVSTPGGRRQVVRDKYRFALVTAALALAVELVMTLCLVLSGKENALFSLTLCTGSVMACMLINSIMLPLLFRFGQQKARVIMIGITAALTGAIGALGTIAGLMYRGGDESYLLVIAGMALPTLAALPVSYRVSQKIYAKKEF